MSRLRASLTFRLVMLGLMQLAVLSVVAVLIAMATMPGPPGQGPPPRRVGQEHQLMSPPGTRPPRPPPRDRPYDGPLMTLIAGIFVIGAGGYLTARWMVIPLRALARAARRIGEGDLSARADLSRRDEIGDVARAFNEMADRIAAQMASERELLANVSHELRTPLARIRVALDLASEGDRAAASAAMSDIGTDLAELEAIVNDILVTARLDSAARGGIDVLAPNSLHATSALDIAHQAESRFVARHPDRALCVSGEDVEVQIDRMLFRRVLDNLLENARKYSPDKSVPIDLEVGETSNEVCFEVRDRGIGIAEADLPHVFEPFFRAERSRTRDAGGVGLGLTLTRRIVDAHGGRIEIQSEVGKGTQVRVSLPRTHVPSEPN